MISFLPRTCWNMKWHFRFGSLEMFHHTSKVHAIWHVMSGKIYKYMYNGEEYGLCSVLHWRERPSPTSTTLSSLSFTTFLTVLWRKDASVLLSQSIALQAQIWATHAGGQLMFQLSGPRAAWSNSVSRHRTTKQHAVRCCPSVAKDCCEFNLW